MLKGRSYALQISKLVVFTYSVFFYGNISAQIVKDDFDGNSTIKTWFGDDCKIGINTANPLKTGLNTSEKVLEYRDEGGQYANVRFDIDAPFKMSASQRFSLKIYVPSSGITGSQKNQVALKLQDGRIATPWSTQCEIIKPISLDSWQILNFDFGKDPYINLNSGSLSPDLRKDFTRVVIQINGEDNTDKVLAYLDEFYYEAKEPPKEVFDRLVWQDEFDGNGELDLSKWFKQSKLPDGNGWFNGEIQHYTNRLSNSYIDNGVLKIVAKKESFTDQGVNKPFTSARLNSKFAFKYGKVDARIRLPKGAGTWPAFWMLGKNIDENGAYWQSQGYGTTPWPACGEIDILEHWGSNQNFVQSAIHTPSSFGGTINKGGRSIPSASSEFHIYSLEWTEDKMVFSIDSVTHYVYEPQVKDANTWPFDKEQYLLLNLAILPQIDPGFSTGAMEVDYIRIYQRSSASTAKRHIASSPAISPNPVSNVLRINFTSLESTSTLNYRVYGMDGGVLMENTAIATDGIFSINGLDQLSPGVYYLNIGNNGNTYIHRFIKI